MSLFSEPGFVYFVPILY